MLVVVIVVIPSPSGKLSYVTISVIIVSVVGVHRPTTSVAQFISALEDEQNSNNAKKQATLLTG